MKKIIALFTVLSVFMIGCTKTEVTPSTESDRTVIVSATIPAEETSRVSYDTSGAKLLNISLAWNEEDKLKLCFVHNGKYYYQDASLQKGTITEGGKKAKFKFTLPEGIPTGGSFTLHAVYQRTDGEESNGGYFLKDTEKYVFENCEESRIALKKNENESDAGIIRPTLKYTQENAKLSTLKNMPFEHLGWLMAIHLTNTTNRKINLGSALTLQYKKEDTSSSYIYNGNQSYDLINVDLKTKQIHSEKADNKLVLFNIANSPFAKETLDPQESIVIYRWLISTPQIEEMSINLYPQNDAKITASTPLPPKSIENGKVYHVYLKWNDYQLEQGK